MFFFFFCTKARTQGPVKLGAGSLPLSYSPSPSPRACTKMRAEIITLEDVGECLKLRGRHRRKKVWVMGQEGQRTGSTKRSQRCSCLVLSHLFVTSIWMVKLDRKTRKVQAA